MSSVLRNEESQVLVDGALFISCLRLFSNGDLAIGFAEGTIQILDFKSKTFKSWTLEDGSSIQKLKGHTQQILSIQEWPQNCLVSGSEDGTIRFWDLSNGTCTRTISSKFTVSAIEVLLKYQFLDNCLATNSFSSNDIMILDTSGTCLDKFEGHNDAVLCLKVYENYLISGSHDHTIKVWDLGDKSCVATFKGHGSSVYALAIFKHEDFLFLASASNDHTIKIWNLSKLMVGTPSTECYVRTLAGHTAAVLSLQVWDEYLLSSSVDGTIKIWNPVDDLKYEVQTIKIYTNPISAPAPTSTSSHIPIVRDLEPPKPKPEPAIHSLQILGNDLISSALGLVKMSNLPVLTKKRFNHGVDTPSQVPPAPKADPLRKTPSNGLLLMLSRHSQTTSGLSPANSTTISAESSGPSAERPKTPDPNDFSQRATPPIPQQGSDKKTRTHKK